MANENMLQKAYGNFVLGQTMGRSSVNSHLLCDRITNELADSNLPTLAQKKAEKHETGGIFGFANYFAGAACSWATELCAAGFTIHQYSAGNYYLASVWPAIKIASNAYTGIARLAGLENNKEK